MQPTTDQRIPSLDDIARDPGCVVGLPTRMLAGLQARAAAAVAGLAAAVLAGSDGGNQAQPKSSTMGLLNTEQMAAFLKVKESWVASEARAGRIPKKMVGRYVRFDPAEVESAVSERGIVCR